MATDTKPSRDLVNHDTVFKISMENIATARDFLESHLPTPIKAKIDLSQLASLKTDFTTTTMKQRHCDVLFKTNINGDTGYLYILVEQQSRADKFMPLRMLEYQLHIMQRYKKKEKLPIVVPLIFYTGKLRYPYSTDIFDLFDDGQQALAKTCLLQPVKLLDLSQIPHDELLHHGRAALMELVMKAVWENKAKQLVQLLNEVLGTYYNVNESTEARYIDNMLYYYLSRATHEQSEQLLSVAPALIAPVGEHVMAITTTLFDKGVEQGMQQGMQQGLEEAKLAMVRSMLADNVDHRLIAKYAELPLEIIQRESKALVV